MEKNIDVDNLSVNDDDLSDIFNLDDDNENSIITENDFFRIETDDDDIDKIITINDIDDDNNSQ
jgi:hypothetical protein